MTTPSNELREKLTTVLKMELSPYLSSQEVYELDVSKGVNAFVRACEAHTQQAVEEALDKCISLVQVHVDQGDHQSFRDNLIESIEVFRQDTLSTNKPNKE